MADDYIALKCYAIWWCSRLVHERYLAFMAKLMAFYIVIRWLSSLCYVVLLHAVKFFSKRFCLLCVCIYTYTQVLNMVGREQREDNIRTEKKTT